MTATADGEQLRAEVMAVRQSSEEIREAPESIRRRIVEDVVHASPLRRKRLRGERVAAFRARRLKQRAKRLRYS